MRLKPFPCFDSRSMQRDHLAIVLGVSLTCCTGRVVIPLEGDAGGASDHDAGGTPDHAAGGSGACRDDRPAPGTPFVEGGQACALPDGGQGVGAGAYGCEDPAACNCPDVAALASCDAGACLYAECNGANEGASCVAGGGGVGTCCTGSCSAATAGAADLSNCGGCGVVCPENTTCGGAGCMLSCQDHACAVGRRCGYVWGADFLSSGPGFTSCLPADCVTSVDGSRCAVPTDAGPLGWITGVCCGRACVDVTKDDGNCGECGTVCCSGTHCQASMAGLSPTACL